MKHDKNKKAKNSHAGVVHTDDVKAKSSIVAAETMSKLKHRLQFNSEFEETNSPYPGFLRQQRAQLSNVSFALTLAHCWRLRISRQRSEFMPSYYQTWQVLPGPRPSKTAAPEIFYSLFGKH
jgi:hypothetical protein